VYYLFKYVHTRMYTYIHKGSGSPVAYSGPNKRTPKRIMKFARYFVLDAVVCGTAHEPESRGFDA